MKRILIGIHGLGNKPAPDLMHSWWRKSLYEGFRFIGHPRRGIPFETVYWADIFHRMPFDPAVRDEDDERYLAEPYLPSPGRRPFQFEPVRRKILDMLEKPIKRMDLEENGSSVWKHINDLVMRNFFQELEAYHANSLEIVPGAEVAYRDIVRARLANKLRQHRDKQILLIAHSMGSIIAFDVLSQVAPEIEIHTLITIGSPLGVPVVMQNIRQEQNSHNREMLRTPETISAGWYNLADLADKVTFHYRLGDDFEPNSRGIAPVDEQVVNDYAVKGDRNPHKVYGYLRTPELARICFDFLSAGESPGAIRRKDLFYKTLEWSLKLLRLG
jgi:pimeloyl-ACP methyl ester carboxylesterase